MSEKPTIEELKSKFHNGWVPVAVSERPAFEFIQGQSTKIPHNFKLDNEQNARRAQNTNAQTWHKYKVELWAGYWVLIMRVVKNKAYRDPDAKPKYVVEEETVYNKHKENLLKLHKQLLEHDEHELAESVLYFSEFTIVNVEEHDEA